MITVISKNELVYTYSGVQYSELTASILTHHIAQGEFLVDVDFQVTYRDEELPAIPSMIYGGDIVEQALVIQAINQTSQWKSEQVVEDIIVVVDGKSYSGSVKAQQENLFAVQVLSDRPISETLVKRTVDGAITSLTLDKFKDIQVKISDEQENIFTAEEHAYADAAGNIIIQ